MPLSDFRFSIPKMAMEDIFARTGSRGDIVVLAVENAVPACPLLFRFMDMLPSRSRLVAAEPTCTGLLAHLGFQHCKQLTMIDGKRRRQPSCGGACRRSW